VAHALGRRPEVRKALAAGAISEDAAGIIVLALDALPDDLDRVTARRAERASTTVPTKPPTTPTGRSSSTVAPGSLATRRGTEPLPDGPAEGGSGARMRRPQRVGSPGMSTDWRKARVDELRTLLLSADPAMVEDVKWRKPSNPDGVPTWSHDGILCTGETYKSVVKMTFARGASLEDPAGLFNSSLEGTTRRAIDFREGDEIDEEALKALVGAAVALNAARARK
jgi:hypothetical protein